MGWEHDEHHPEPPEAVIEWVFLCIYFNILYVCFVPLTSATN